MAEPKTPAAPGGTKLIVVSICLAIASVIAVNLYIQSVRAAVNESSFEVYVLTRSVYPGDRLSPKDVREIRVPNSFRTSFDSLYFVDKIGLENSISQRDIVKRSANMGEILLPSVFTGGKDIDDLARNIVPGKRLIWLPVNSNAVPGLLRPGVWVDIEAPFVVPGSPLPMVKPVMERVQIKAVGLRTLADETDENANRSNRSLGAFHTITIEVTPTEATSFDMIKRIATGDFELHIRNAEDGTTPNIPEGGINPDVLELIGKRLKQAVPAKP